MIPNDKKNRALFGHIPADILWCVCLVITILLVYGQVTNHSFVSLDDKLYVTDNQHVNTGLTLENILWAITSTRAAHWHPLTWMSHMLDVEFYKMKSGGHHITSLLFHIVNTLLLFILLRRMTGAFWKSWFVAAFFALHPLHVESVAWIAERKDVLSTFFWLLTLFSYARYTERPSKDRYLITFLCFMLGLMSKPMLVTIPFVLLLFDYWPLGRFKPFTSSNGTTSTLQKNIRSQIYHLLYEKIPFFALSAVSCTVTYLIQKSAGVMAHLETLPFHVRLTNSLISYTGFLWKMICPYHLTVLKPLPEVLQPFWVVGSVLLIVFLFVFAVIYMREYPWFIVGWLLYFGTLVPVIGLVQNTIEFMPDRYTYVSLTGVFIVFVWGFSMLTEKLRIKRWLAVSLAGTALCACIILTWQQVKYWRDSVTLYKRAIAVTDNNWMAYNNYGVLLSDQGKKKEAIDCFKKALNAFPDYEHAHNNLAVNLSSVGRYDDAARHYLEAIKINPDYEGAHNNMAELLFFMGRYDDAGRYYYEVIRINPNNAEAYNRLGSILAFKGKIKKAEACFKTALLLKPDFHDARANLNDIHTAGARLRGKKIDQVKDSAKRNF